MRQWRLRQHGLELGDYDDMVKAQGHKCALCGVIEDIVISKRKRRFDVDHCHAQGHVRGLLCNRCNTTLGKVRDNPELLRRMADYVEVGGIF